jgi:hypothetical protein
LNAGKKLKEEADEKFKPCDHDKTDNYSYTLFMTEDAESMLEYVERKVYEGKGAFENRETVIFNNDSFQLI